MDKFALLSDQERKEILQEASNRKGLKEIILEKDYWVCWTLRRLYSNPKIAPYLTFKGGTSLSKAYSLINRFSEDIDLTISRSAPFLEEGKDPTENGISSNESKRRINDLKQNARRFINEIILPELTSDIQIALNPNGNWKIELDPEDADNQTLLFYYPEVFSYGSGGYGHSYGSSYGQKKYDYIRPIIKLEFGARGEIIPHESRGITPYVCQVIPEIFGDISIEVTTLSAERTFWEKVTILHSLFHGVEIKDRMSRHYYDTYMLYKNGVAEAALQQPELLEMVVKNKSQMFQSTKASYDTAQRGTIKITPTSEQKEILKKDYSKMNEMFMAEHPEFEEMMKALCDLEATINTPNTDERKP